MKKLMMFALMMTFVSCGGGSNSDLQALRGAGADSASNPYSQLTSIKQQYGITNDTDIVSVLESVKTDLRDSGVYINVDHVAQLRPVAAPGTDWSERKTARKVKRALDRKLNGKPTPKGIIWQKTIDECEDLTVSVDRVDDGSYDAARVAPLIEHYVILAQAYLTETNIDEINCQSYKEIDQAQIEMKRIFMGSVSSNDFQGTSTGIRNVSGLNVRGNGTREVLPK